MEVLVAPALEARVVVGAERLERLLAGAVEVARVVLEAVVRREVYAAAEPPGVAGGEIAHVHVYRGAVRVARVQYERHACGLPRAAGKLRARGRRRRGQLAAPHAGQVDASALEDLPVLDDARSAATALGPLPGIAAERLAVEHFERDDEALLQVREEVLDRVAHRRFSARWPMSLRYWAPAKRMRSMVSYARVRAMRTESPSAVTHSTRPPLVRSALPSSRVPAWNTRQSFAAGGMPVMASPPRGSSG